MSEKRYKARVTGRRGVEIETDSLDEMAAWAERMTHVGEVETELSNGRKGRVVAGMTAGQIADATRKAEAPPEGDEA